MLTSLFAPEWVWQSIRKYKDIIWKKELTNSHTIMYLIFTM